MSSFYKFANSPIGTSKLVANRVQAAIAELRKTLAPVGQA
jgi:hypothetical protein